MNIGSTGSRNPVRVLFPVVASALRFRAFAVMAQRNDPCRAFPRYEWLLPLNITAMGSAGPRRDLCSPACRTTPQGKVVNASSVHSPSALVVRKHAFLPRPLGFVAVSQAIGILFCRRVAPPGPIVCRYSDRKIILRLDRSKNRFQFFRLFKAQHLPLRNSPLSLPVCIPLSVAVRKITTSSLPRNLPCAVSSSRVRH